MSETLREEQASRYRAVAARVPGNVTVVAVSKTQPCAAIEAVYGLGHRDFGENYVQELVSKAVELRARGCEGIRWHFIGALQRNKVKTLVPYLSVLHTLDSERLADEVSARWKAARPGERLPVFIQVNIDRQGSKAGVLPEDVPKLANHVSGLPLLDLQGLMCIPDPAKKPEAGDPGPYTRLYGLCRGLGSLTAGKLSMGMTHDYVEAIRAGATHVRIGTALFGVRAP